MNTTRKEGEGEGEYVLYKRDVIYLESRRNVSTNYDCSCGSLKMFLKAKCSTKVKKSLSQQ